MEVETSPNKQKSQGHKVESQHIGVCLQSWNLRRCALLQVGAHVGALTLPLQITQTQILMDHRRRLKLSPR